jgi:hypothetical protein
VNPSAVSLPDECGSLIYRQTTFDVATFDHLKRWHRELERRHRRRLTNAQVLRALILSVPLPS